ncbi:hypothetical protein CYMTET_42226 [Cymbomonas tetramitiformis]|uniref:Uncharacterized protein n=1 Tax=Cymbomonas tetramitiformis TaxID=36881 RepID=A0AAE0F1Q6_9CHLO|nr:hypothetical protein CYMTET_42229 [Cymbomonas tetramitiformis]KAK3248304.1 hypothetical protein CYMTET_42226 [Cymbomonas tetramitiformis]
MNAMAGDEGMPDLLQVVLAMKTQLNDMVSQVKKLQGVVDVKGHTPRAEKARRGVKTFRMAATELLEVGGGDWHQGYFCQKGGDQQPLPLPFTKAAVILYRFALHPGMHLPLNLILSNE